jgi:sugar/nucleoside kinase (ribokinase family)
LMNYGVSAKYIRQTSGDSGITTAIIDHERERTFYSYRGVNASGELSKIPDNLFSEIKFLHMSGYSFQDDASQNNALELIKMAKKFGTLISLDPSFWYSQEYHKKNPSLLSNINIIFPNKEEAKILGGSDDPKLASKALLEMGPEIVVITLGSEGCFISSKKESFFLPALPIPNVVDTTGAGDAFCGGFLAGLIKGLNIKESAIIGNIASSKVIGNIGGHKGAPSLDDLRNILIRDREEGIAQKIMSSNPQQLIESLIVFE